MRVALLDGDIFAHESASKGEKKFDWGEGIESLDVDGEYAEANLRARINTVQEATKADRVIVALSDPGRRYFRHDLWPEYKSHRTGSPPVLLTHLKQWLADNNESFWKPKLEADDVLGILATGPYIQGETIIVTADKDLKQVPGLHLNPRKLEEGIYTVTPEQGFRWHMIQTLTGDATDHFPGCPRVPGHKKTGPVTAASIVDEALAYALDWGMDLPAAQRHVWSRVVEEFVTRGATEEDCMVQARVAKILQSPQWDGKKQEIIPWDPSTT